MISRSRWPRRLALAVAIVLVTCSPAFAIQYNPIENHGETECALLLDGPGRSSQLDYNLNTLRGTFGYRGPHTCITYDAVNQAYINARKRIQVAQPHGPWSASDVATVGELLLDISIQLAKTYGLTYEDVEKGLPLIDTSKTLIREVCPPYLANVECRPGKYRRYDGLCTNLQHPTWGAINTPFTRLVGPLFADGMTAPRISVTGSQLPLARVVSRTMHPDEGFHDHAGTVMIVAWGQFMDHDYTLTATPLDPLNKNEPEECCNRPPHLKNPYCMEIPIPEDDYFYRLTDVRCMDFVRAFPAVRPGCRLGSRIPYNTLTGVLDGNTVYGVTEKFARHLRTGYGGLLRMNAAFNEYGLKDLLPLKLDIPDEGCTRPNRSMFCFEAGEIRVNEQLILACMHTLMAREHNRLAKGLAQVNPHWDDETLYQEARRIVIAEIQHITYNEFLPILLGKEVMEKFGLLTQKEGYWDGYDPEVNPSVIDAFAAAAFRFGHSLLPTAVERWSKAHKFIASRRLSDLIRRPYDLYRAGVMDEYFMGLMNQVAQAMDDSVTQEVTNHLFKKPGKRFGMDLASFNMQRGREFGVPGYMEFRKFCGLPGAESFEELLGSMPNTTIKRYASIYQHPSDVDLWSGGVSERPLPGSMVGPTFACIIATQFSYSRRGDRFWYELGNQPSSFTPEQLAEIRKMKLSRVICDNTDLIDTVQVYPLVLPDHEINPRVPCKSGILPSIDLSKWADYSGGHHAAAAVQSGNIPFDLDPEKPSKNIVTFFAAVSPTEKFEAPPSAFGEGNHVTGMTEAVITDDRPNKTEVPDIQTNHTIVKRHTLFRMKRSDEDLDDEDGPEGRLTVSPDDDHDDGMIDIDDDGPYEYITTPDDHDDITIDPSDVAEQTEDAGDHDDDDDTNTVVDVSDDLDIDDPPVKSFRPIQKVTVPKKSKRGRKRPKTRHSSRDRNSAKKSVLFKVRQTDHSTVTKPKSKQTRYRHKDKYDINWSGRHKKPTFESSSKTISSHPSSSQFLSPQTLRGFLVKGNPNSDEDVDQRTKFRTNEKERTDIRYSRKTPRVRKKETSEVAFDESYKARGKSPPRWSSSYIRLEEPNSPLLSSVGEQGFSGHHPRNPADDHPVSFSNAERDPPAFSELGLQFPSTSTPAVLTTQTYNPGQNIEDNMGDAKMKRITEEINKILMGNFDFKPRFSPPRKEYHPNKLLSQVDDQEDRGDDHEKERNVDEAEGNLDEEDQQKEKPQDRGNKDDERQRDEDADRKEDAPPKQGEEEESTTKTDERTTNEEQKSGDDGGSSELQVETPPRKELGASGRQEDQEDEIMTTEGIRGSGGDTSKESDKRNDSVALREDPKTKRGPVLFQVANAREDDSREDDSLMKKIKMKCVPVSDETVSDDVGKEENEKKNKAVEEIKHKATDGNSKERVQEADNQTENPETNEVSTVSQDEELDNREEDEMKIEEGRKDGDDLKRKEQVSGEVEHSTTHEEPERKEDEDVKNEVSPKQDEDAERKEEKSNIQSAPSRDDKSKEEGSRSNIGKPPKIKVKPEEKDEYYSEEYKRHGGIDYKDSQSHRHKETDKEQHKHHGREEGGHDDRQEHEHAFGKHNHGSKLEGVDKDNKDDFQQKHLLEKQKQLQSERHLKKGNYEQQHLASSKEQIGLKDGEENKYKRHGDALSGSHLGASSLDKIPVIEIFDGVPGVDYSKHSDYSEQAPRVPSTTHVTPFTTPNPSQLLVESNRHELPIKGHFSSAPNPYQQRYELPSSTPLESLPSKTLNHFSISSTFDTITTPQEHLLTTTPTHQLIIQTSNSLTIPNHDNLFTTTPNQRPLVLTQDLLHVTSTPNDQLLVTTPSHIPFISTTHEVPNVSPQEGRVAIRHQPAETTELEHEKISTTTASSKIIDQLDKYKSDQHNDLLKSQEDADRQLKKQINEVNQELKGLNAVNTLPPETSATDKRNKQQLDWQDYQQQLYYPKPSPKPQGLPPFITVEVEKRRPPILVEDVDYPELVDTRGHRAVNDEYAEPIVPTGRHRYYV